MNTKCCMCTNTDDLTCPACDKAFCISCFVDHGKACYEQSRKKQTEQGEAGTKRKAEEEARRHKATYTTYQCSGCGKTENCFTNAQTSFWWKCPICCECYCRTCRMEHVIYRFDEQERVYKPHYQSHHTYAHQQTYTTDSDVSQGLTAAFSVLQLSTRATVQEVKNAFRYKAKQGEYRHPDVGGSKEQFIKLNNAYELALAHAERNER